ncbi:hypothetical protein ThimaDRAFT_2139 [Thiocapsa marina 5811]|uniref:Uncharacterized protein n=1 Tax=Thiocapsa marina 5811 TaxID=768671 RepID=F9UBA3_9GAMM|nr:hypothetical protein ThimaDRAFT_2139 [Thiocapsa marina 5811]
MFLRKTRMRSVYHARERGGSASERGRYRLGSALDDSTAPRDPGGKEFAGRERHRLGKRERRPIYPVDDANDQPHRRDLSRVRALE